LRCRSKSGFLNQRIGFCCHYQRGALRSSGTGLVRSRPRTDNGANHGPEPVNTRTYPVHTPYIPRTYPVHTPYEPVHTPYIPRTNPYKPHIPHKSHNYPALKHRNIRSSNFNHVVRLARRKKQGPLLPAPIHHPPISIYPGAVASTTRRTLFIGALSCLFFGGRSSSGPLVF
jgi:hypothetical protein